MKTKKIDQEVLAVLSRCIIDGNRLQLPGQLDRKLYVAVNKVLEAAGGTWHRKSGMHVFNTDAAERLEGIMLTGEYALPPRDAFEFFPTPPAVLDLLMAAAAVEPFMTALEPSMGDGAIVRRLIAADAKVTAQEIDERHGATIPSGGYLGQLTILWGDFLAWRPGHPEHQFDRIVMNPPFSRQRDIDHVLHALKFLKPGGRLVAVMSAGVDFRQDRKAENFRAVVRGRHGTIKALPADSFKMSGTAVNTVMVTMDG